MTTPKPPSNMPHITTTAELITPEVAEDWLTNGHQMRTISPVTVHTHVIEIEAGRFKPYPAIEKSDKDKLLNGFHRLTAIVQTGKAQWMLVSRGIPFEYLKHMDIVRPRSLREGIKEFRPNDSHPALRGPYVSMMAYLRAGMRVSIRSVDYYTEWFQSVSESVNWAVEFCAGSNIIQPAPVGGALAFAYKTDPKMVEKFALELKDFEGLRRGDPSHTLLKFLDHEHPGKKSGTYRLDFARKVLNATKAYLEGTKLLKVTAVDDGRQFFMQAHEKNKKLTNLAEPWMVTAS